ncbi:MAG: hypothetical protein ACREEM_48225 [Blastocatellia bacterium]
MRRFPAGTLAVESRIKPEALRDLVKMGVKVRALPMYDYHTGSFQMCWRDEKSGLLSTSADPRRAGNADGF